MTEQSGAEKSPPIRRPQAEAQTTSPTTAAAAVSAAPPPPAVADEDDEGPAPDLRTIAANFRDAAGNLAAAPPVYAEAGDLPEGVDPKALEGTPEWLIERMRRRNWDEPLPDRDEALFLLQRGYTVGRWAGVPNYECVWCPDRPNQDGDPRPVTANINKQWMTAHLQQVHLVGLPDAEEGVVYYRALGGELRSRRI